MSKSQIDDVLSELCSYYRDGNTGLSYSEMMEMMQIARLDRIADALENIDQSLQALSGCIGPKGSFCIAGEVVTSDY